MSYLLDRHSFDLELERNILGLTMLGGFGDLETPELSASDFFCFNHQRIFAVARATNSLSKTVASLRNEGWLWSVEWHGGTDRCGRLGMLSSVDLLKMTQEAEWTLRQGWHIDAARLRELARIRRLADGLRRAQAQLRGGHLGHAEVVNLVRELIGEDTAK